VQLLEMKARVIVALNMMDMAESRRYRIDVNELSRLMGVPVVPMVASRNQGTDELLRTIVDVERGIVQADGLEVRYGKEVEEEIAKLERTISLSSLALKYPPRWLAIKLLEEDEETMKMLTEVKSGNR
jgi:ferrous iron transport protein B